MLRSSSLGVALKQGSDAQADVVKVLVQRHRVRGYPTTESYPCLGCC